MATDGAAAGAGRTTGTRSGGAAASVYTVPPHRDFVTALAGGLLDRFGSTPEGLAPVLVLLPTRRACRTLREAFLRLSGGAPLLLPRMRPIDLPPARTARQVRIIGPCRVADKRHAPDRVHGAARGSAGHLFATGKMRRAAQRPTALRPAEQP